MRTKKDRDFWTIAAPNIDAWMLLIGRNREAFNLSLFVTKYPNIASALKRLRKIANVLVLPSGRPVLRAIEENSRGEDDEETHEESEVPSQSYWTTIKSWRPW